ncbi:dihydromonapterin reductase [Pleionea sediminis]|uniref:dihydromonapterin reductase n=1 Tax=Pleionea sediminis TaxID=2569479 RepID=UPI00197C2F62|nr:dihydromonapterin reductase [Pleionea sediminis]
MIEGPIVITGGAQRFGLELAKSFIKSGHSVVVTYRTKHDRVNWLRDRGVDCVQADIIDDASINELVGYLKQHYSKLRALIHNASDWITDQSEESPSNIFDRSMLIHAKAPYLLNWHLKEELKSNYQSFGRADIIHMSDFIVEKGSKKHLAYAASKAALDNLTKSFAAKYAPEIKVNAIAPSLMMFNEDDDEFYRERAKEKHLLSPGPGEREGINAVQFLMESKYITGRTISLDGGRSLI